MILKILFGRKKILTWVGFDPATTSRLVCNYHIHWTNLFLFFSTHGKILSIYIICLICVSVCVNINIELVCAKNIISNKSVKGNNGLA